MNDIENINKLGEEILNHWALNDTKQLGLQACEIATRLFVENEKLLKEKQERENNVCFNCVHLTMLDRNADLNGQYWHCTLFRGEETKNVWHKYRKHYKDYSLVEHDDFCFYFEAGNK